jgi:N-acetylglucosamine-6-sulfatase
VPGGVRIRSRRSLKGASCLVLALLSVLLVCVSGGAQERREANRPNILLIMTDDLSLQDMRYMPKTRTLFSVGAEFRKSYVTYSICCPSRATFLRGQYSHNHRIHGNWEPYGGAEKFRRLGRDTVATWLQDAGYKTHYVGKYLNGYIADHVPAGWDEWYGKDQRFRLNQYNINGEVVQIDEPLDARYVRDRTNSFIEEADDRPFFIFSSFHAPHQPHQWDSRYDNAYQRAKAPRTQNFGLRHNAETKPRWVQRMAERQFNIGRIDERHRERARALRTLDDAIAEIVVKLREAGQLQSTYIFLTSDNGYKEGQHGLYEKWTAYEEDIRIPLLVRGPGVPNRSFPHMVLNNDFAPTAAEIAGIEAPSWVDGTSYASLLRGERVPLPSWRKRFLVENFESEFPRGTPAPYPPYLALRTQHLSYIVHLQSRERELYNIARDPWQTRSLHRVASRQMYQTMHRMIRNLRTCSGDSCARAEGFPGR